MLKGDELAKEADRQAFVEENHPFAAHLYGLAAIWYGHEGAEQERLWAEWRRDQELKLP